MSTHVHPGGIVEIAVGDRSIVMRDYNWHGLIDKIATLTAERDRARESERQVTAYKDDLKKLIIEGRQIIEGLKGFFPELVCLEKVDRFLKLAKEVDE